MITTGPSNSLGAAIEMHRGRPGVAAEQLCVFSDSSTRQLEIVRGFRDELRKKEESFFNFISAENALGLSVLINGGDTFSSSELRAVEEVVAKLEEMDRGLKAVAFDFSEGRNSNWSNYYVREFIENPLSKSLELHLAATANQAPLNKQTATNADLSSIIKMAMDYGAVHLALTIYEDEKKRFSDEEKGKLAAILPGWFERFRINELRTFANATVSLDSLALILGGSLFGRFVGASSGGIRVGLMDILTRGPSFSLPRLFTPGLPVIKMETRNASLPHKLLYATASTGGEIIKAGLFTNAANFFFGDTGAKIVGAFFAFSIGYNPSLAGAWKRRFINDLRTHAPNVVLDKMAHETAFSAASTTILREMEDQISRSQAVKLLEVRARDITRRITISQKNAGTLSEAKRLLDELEVMAKAHPSIRDHLLKARSAVSNGQIPRKALAAVRREFGRAQNLVSEETRRAAKTVSPPLSRGQKNHRKGGSGFGSVRRSIGSLRNRLERHFSVADFFQVAHPISRTSPFAEFVSSPPGRLEIAEITRRSGNRIAVLPRAQDPLRWFYERNPEHRRSFWSFLSDALDGKFRRTRKIYTAEDQYRQRFGDYRVLFERDGGKMNIVDVLERGSIKRWGTQ